MQRTLLFFFLACVGCLPSAQAAKEILLRLAPSEEAPVIAKVTASKKVILDAAPAPQNAEQGWRQLALPTPFEGYVPTAAMGKNFEIVEGTPIHYLPTANSAQITRHQHGDLYEVVRVKEEWATVRYRKDITGYFIDDSTEEVAIDFEKLNVPLVSMKSVPNAFPAPEAVAIPEPVAIPAPRARVNPDEPIGQLDPNALPEENVVWKPAVPATESSKSPDPEPQISEPAAPLADPIMVSPDQTQAREAPVEVKPPKAPRLLTGKLVRQIRVDGPEYPIQLQSPEGRLIAYVDFSGIYINDLSPYINQKVYIRGQIYPIPNTRAQLVILAETLRLAE